MNWEDVRYFLAVARGGSFAAAARELGVAATTIGRRVARLEDDLGQPILARTPAGYQATERGEALLRSAEEIERRMLSIRAAMQHSDVVRGHVRVATMQLLANRVLSPRLHELLSAYPELTVSLIGDNRVADLLRREADVSVRLDKPDRAGLVGRRIGSVAINLYVSRDALARWGVEVDGVASVRDLAGLDVPLITLQPAQSEAAELAFLGKSGLTPRVAVRSNSLMVMEQAILGGAGVGFLPEFLASPNTELVPLLDRTQFLPRDIWLVVHEDVRTDAAVRAVIDWLVDVIGDVAVTLRGGRGT